MDKEALRKNIKENLIHLRINKDITQAELASRVGKSKTAVASWEQGLSLPDLTTLWELSILYGENVEYFYLKHTD